MQLTVGNDGPGAPDLTVNCYAGKGGDPMTTQDAPVYDFISLADCKSTCDSVFPDGSCVAIVHQEEVLAPDPVLRQYGACWHRKAVRPAECEIDHSLEFRTHVRAQRNRVKCSLGHGGEPLGGLLSCRDATCCPPGPSCEDHGLRACSATDGCVGWWQNTTVRHTTQRYFQLLSSVHWAECEETKEWEKDEWTYKLDAWSSSPSLV